MKEKGMMMIFLTVVVAIALGLLSFLGIGSNHILGVRNIPQGLDLKGGVSIDYQAGVSNPSKEEMNAAISLIRRRLDAKNYTEATVSAHGTDRIHVEIPGVEDADQAVSEIGKTALLTFQDEDGNVLLTGADVANARREIQGSSTGAASQIVVALTFSDTGALLFEEATGNNIGKTMAIYLDDELISAPNVNERISGGSAVISGNFTAETAEQLATYIREGSLPFALNVISVQNVGATLGANALRTSIIAGIIGFLLVLIFMVVVYKLQGACADLALILYTCIVLIILSAFRITLTLPGIAGIILSIGMAVDANVVIFERIREEIENGRTVRSALDAGYKRAFPAILDSNVTTLIAAVVLFWLGTGPIKGFAQTLSIGIVVSMFTALVVTRFIVSNFMGLGVSDPKLYGARTAENAGKFRLFPIIANRKRFFVFSLGVISLGILLMIINGAMGRGAFNYDVEFSGGTSFQIDIGKDFSNDDLADIVRDITGQPSPMVQRIIGTDQVAITIRSIDLPTRQSLIDEITTTYGISDDAVSYTDISATVSNEMQKTALLAITIACICMLIYVSIRFRDIRMGSAAIMALLHDALIMLTIYAVLRVPLNYSFIAAILTILGYSINATIIIFDRIRENKVRLRKADTHELIDTSVSQTLRRSIYTSITTMLSIFFLLILGVSSIQQFALPIFIGLIFGAYSSVCLSGSFWYILVKGMKAKA